MAKAKPPDEPPKEPPDEPPNVGALHPKRRDNPSAKCPRSPRADMRLLLEAAWAQGAWIVRGGNDHFKVYAADQKTMIHVPMTPSDFRTVRNKRLQMKRAGIDPNYNKRRK
jgi:hypothetical protein